MPDETHDVESSTWRLLAEADVVFGGQDQLAGLKTQHAESPQDDVGRRRLEEDWLGWLEKLQVRIGTLLKTDTFSLLLGAGASREAGGVLMSRVPLEVERAVLGVGLTGPSRSVKGWVHCFYAAIRTVAARRDPAPWAPATAAEVQTRDRQISENTAEPIGVNLEQVLSLLFAWRTVLADSSCSLRLATPAREIKRSDVDESLRQATRAVAVACELPKVGSASGSEPFADLLRKVLTRPLNLKRINIFSVNYDTLVERAADREGIVLIDGFIGSLARVFRPECYDQDLYFPAQTTEGRVHRLDRVAHLYKLHGSITWESTAPAWDNPYGVVARASTVADPDRVLIYPTPAKVGESLGMPYAELFRRFAASIVRPQSTLVVIGYGFGDDHVNAVIHQALAVPSFSLVIVDPDPGSEFVRALRQRADPRVSVLSGKTFGTFSGFVGRALPDLGDEDVRKQVVETYRALAAAVEPTPEPGATSGN